MSNIAIISNTYSTQAFASLGIRIETTSDPNNASQMIDTLLREKYSLIFITEDLAEINMDKIETVNNKGTSYISLIPDITGKNSLAFNKIAKKAKNAIGTNVVGRN